VEQPVPDGGAISGAVSCHPGGLLGPSVKKITGEGQVL